MSFFLSEQDFPDKYGVVTLAANFYPLWVAALIPAIWLMWEKKSLIVLKSLLLSCLALFALFAVCPLPHWFCDATLLIFITEERCLLPIGLAGIIFSLLVLDLCGPGFQA